MSTILILDTSSLIHTGFYALKMLRNSKGEHIGAIKSVVKQLDKLIKEINPMYIIAAQDVKRSELKRKEIYKEYKENRSKTPEELISQIGPIEDILKGYNIGSIKVAGYEADDVIATLCNKYSKTNKIIICTKDKDLSQLVSENVSVYLPNKDIYISNEEEVQEQFFVKPYQIKDYFALIGDSSDGVPGVKGVGPVAGVKLINEYDNLDNIYENIENIKGALKNKLITDKKIAYISKQLVTLFDNLDINIDIEEYRLRKKNISILEDIYLKFELKEELEKLRKDNADLYNISIKEKEYKSYNEFIKNLNSNKNNIGLYYGVEGISYYDGELAHVYISNDKDTLFSENIDLDMISKDLDITVYYSKIFLENNIEFKQYFDILLANYSIETNRLQKLENIIFEKLKIIVSDFNKKSNENYKERLVNLSYGIYKLKEILSKELKEKNKEDIYLEEKRLTPILVYMEKNGISLDKEYFKEFLQELYLKRKELEEIIYKLAGEKFNISSPKQLSNILFEKMGIEPIKKGKIGSSTDVSVLEILKLKGIEIATYLLEYREVVKLITTYLEPMLAIEKNGKIHTTFNQTGTITGRLSSQDPNLQNIPTRTEIGSKIRQGFVAQKGKKLVSFDYSQIELRVLTYVSKDDNLIKSYKKNLDLHELTARKLFNIPNDEQVSKYQRNIGKVINFSIIYGKTPYGLSIDLKIPLNEATEYIEKYLKQYPKVKEFLDKKVAFAKENNYVETIFGLRRYVYDINSNNKNVSEQAKRMVINTVIQGSAANIIKKAMINIYEKLCNNKVKMLLQVHDELIFEIDEDSLDVCEKIKEIMENSVVFEEVKFNVNYSVGDNWAELK